MLSKSVIKYIQSLQQKKFRDEHSAFIAEGPKVVNELILHRSFPVREVYCVASWYARNEGIIPAQHIHVIEEQELERIAHLHTANEVVAVFSQKKISSKVEVKGAVTLLLDDIRDPGNFGTIIRTADWFGIKNIICSEGCVEMYNPKVVQSTMASLGRVNMVYTNLKEWISRHTDVPLFAATLQGELMNESEQLPEAMLLVGNEAHGISKALLPEIKRHITIPGAGNAESLNVAVATGIMLYSFCRRLT